MNKTQREQWASLQLVVPEQKRTDGWSSLSLFLCAVGASLLALALTH